ncbi:holin family protein [Acutalibacter muris]|uniref:phage holin family protein n=1 Tax=Acutalibacter muris TaxID=1796620 RepID=UPI001C3E95A8|nr:phage holin family protein [Acutalibacter muris]
MKESALKTVIAVAVAGATAYFKELALPVIILAVVMSIDYISGMTEAWIRRELSSRVGVLGIVKKVAYLLAVAVAIVADWVVQTAAGEIGVDFGGFYFFGLLVTIWLILNECISILENLSEIGVPLPAFLLKLIEKLKKTVEDTGDSKTN